MTDPIRSSSDIFNNEDSNTTSNPQLEDMMAARLSRRRLLLGSAGAVATSAFGGVGLAGCAATSTTTIGAASALSSPLSSLGFAAVAKSMADKVIVPAGYNVQVIYALGDPLKASTAAFKNDGTDTDWDNRAGDHRDGMEYFGLDANGRPSANGTTRALLAMNHEATTDEKLSSFFIHSTGGTSTLPRPASEVDKELAIHGLSVVEVEARVGQWSYKPASNYNRRVTTMTEVLISGPAKGSEHLATKYSPDATRARGTLNNCGTGKTPWGTFVSGEENWAGYFHRDAKDDERRGRKDKQVAGLVRYGRPAGAASRHGWESA
ncbi:MAG: DUF839 domain-containing protein, partial [Rhodoferax sp.]|nr:DUF839 domain-containing protein [Rhodoferax sp.]